MFKCFNEGFSDEEQVAATFSQVPRISLNYAKDDERERTPPSSGIFVGDEHVQSGFRKRKRLLSADATARNKLVS